MAVSPRRSSPSHRAGLGEREVDLHLGAAVPEALGALPDRLRNAGAGEEPSVERLRKHVAEDGPRGSDGLTVDGLHADGAAVPDQHALHLGIGLADAAVVADQGHEGVDEPRPAAARDRHAAFLHGDGDHLGHEPGDGGVGAEPGVQDPGREQPVRSL